MPKDDVIYAAKIRAQDATRTGGNADYAVDSISGYSAISTTKPHGKSLKHRFHDLTESDLLALKKRSLESVLDGIKLWQRLGLKGLTVPQFHI